MKVALVHDQLNEFGGAERVLLALSDLYPDAPIYTAYCKKGSPAWERFKHKNIKVSWAHYIPGFVTRFHSPLRFLAPLIWNSFDFSSYDIVIGSSSWYVTKGFAKKGPSTGSGRPKTVEICYCHTPPRWLYGYPTSVNWQRYPIVRAYAAIVGFFMRHYDYKAAQRVDVFIANSKETQRRIRKFYRRESTVIYPPIDIKFPQSTKLNSVKQDYYLFVSRPVGGKGLELAVAASKKLGLKLKVVGRNGVNEQGIEYLGIVTDDALASLYAGAKAFLALATHEDFGMTPVEAMSFGTPVIAYNGGGYAETVIEGKTGVLFSDPTVQSLSVAIQRFEQMEKDWARSCKATAGRFNTDRFVTEIQDVVARSVPSDH